MLTQTLTITRNSFTESIRQPIFVVLLLLAIMMLVLSCSWSAYTLEDDNKLMIDVGLSVILFFGIILAAFTASGVLAREIENKTVLTVISKPVGRPGFIIGKFIGVAGAITLAVWIWSLVFLLTVRHKVMSSAADSFDMPVITFSLGALVIALVISIWGNYFYNWVFTSTFSGTLGLCLTIAYLLVLLIDKNWHFQTIASELAIENSNLTQLLIALLLVAQAVWAMCAIAIACSTRLGQVMTLVICIGLFVLGAVGQSIFADMTRSGQPVWQICSIILQAVTPNIQILFMTDALTQHHPISGTYLALVSGYTFLYIVAALGLAIALFQTREAG